MDAAGSAAAPWWEPNSYPLALATVLVSTACWGSWSNTAKAAGSRVNFAHYYTDFCAGTVLAALVLAAGPGASRLGRTGVDPARLGYAAAAGAIFGAANLCLTTGIALAGLAIAFPTCIGTGLVLGTLLTYVVDQRGRPELMCPGVFLALLGVLANAHAYSLLQEGREQSAAAPGDEALAETHTEPSSGEWEDLSDESSSASACESSDAAKEVPQGRLLLICIVGGLLMGCWAPLSAKSMEGKAGLSPYAALVCFTVAAALVGLALLAAQHCCGCNVLPRVGAVTSMDAYAGLRPTLHGWGLLGGSMWAVGTLANLVGGGRLGFALSYALGQAAPVVAVLWGLLWYHEFHGASRQAACWLAGMFLLFGGAIALLVLSGS